MATSISEYIIQNIQTAIRNVKHHNGYDNDLNTNEVFRARASGDVTQYPSVYIYEGEEGIVDREYLGSNTKVIKDMEVIIVLFMSDYEDLATGINSLEADIVKAIMADATRGDYAMYTETGGSSPFFLDGENVGGRTITLSIRYEHKESDPYTQ